MATICKTVIIRISRELCFLAVIANSSWCREDRCVIYGQTRAVNSFWTDNKAPAVLTPNNVALVSVVMRTTSASVENLMCLQLKSSLQLKSPPTRPPSRRAAGWSESVQTRIQTDSKAQKTSAETSAVAH